MLTDAAIQAVPVRTWEFPEAIKSYLSKPEHEMIRVICAHNVYARVNKKGNPVLKWRLVNSIFDALLEPIAALLDCGMTVRDTFEELQRRFSLPDFFSLPQFYAWHAEFFNKKQSVISKYHARLKRAFDNFMSQQKQKGSSAPAGASAVSRNFAFNANAGTPGASSFNATQSSSAGGLMSVGGASAKSADAFSAGINIASQIAKYGSLELPVEKHYPQNRTNVLFKADFKQRGEKWPYDDRAECLILPGPIDEAAYNAIKPLRDALNSPVPTPRNLYTLTADDPRYPFDKDFTLLGGVKFLVDDDGYIYNPYLASVNTAYIPVPVPVDYEPRSSLGPGGTFGLYGMTEPFTTLRNVLAHIIGNSSGSLRRYSSAFGFINVSQGIDLLPVNDPKRKEYIE